MYHFIDHSRKPNFALEELFSQTLRHTKDSDRIIIIIRGILFFCSTQEITLGKLREYFTDHAISKLMGDGYVKFKEDE
jgi:hypothetical protein